MPKSFPFELEALMTEMRQVVQQVLQDALRERRYKQDASVLTDTDVLLQQRLVNWLHEITPGVAVLGEEMDAEAQQVIVDSGKAFWCLDPIDGTRNYSLGLPYFAVSLAWVEKGQVLFGMVLDPERDELFWAECGQGAWLNDQPLGRGHEVVPMNQASGLIDFKRLPKPLAAALATDAPYSSQRSFGGVALDFCWLAAGRVHVYLHGKMNIWDYAAGWLILQEAGGHSVTLSGEPVFKLALEPRSALGAWDAKLFEEWQAWIQEHA